MYEHDPSVPRAIPRLRLKAAVDGHDVKAVRRSRAPGPRRKPFGIVARTFKGKGVPSSRTRTAGTARR
jgi:hypothetical protein